MGEKSVVFHFIDILFLIVSVQDIEVIEGEEFHLPPSGIRNYTVDLKTCVNPSQPISNDVKQSHSIRGGSRILRK